ncbi:MAG: Lcl C-terminal domain-containing protein [Dehalococcoidia bacterium]
MNAEEQEVPEAAGGDTGDDTQAGSRFIDNGDGTVSDALRGLQWQKEDDGIERTYEEAQRYSRELRLAGYDDWRLPRKEELMALAELGYDTLNQIFPNTKGDGYWAQTSAEEVRWAATPENIAYTVEFNPRSANYGADIDQLRSYPFYVRAVRDAR